MSTDFLVRIPCEYEEEEEEKSSEHKDDFDSIQLSPDSGSIYLRHSASSSPLDHIFSPSETYTKHRPSLTIPPKPFDLVRIVSPKECSMLKSNITRVLCDNNYDIFSPFNLSQFIPIFTKILPSSPHDEITKLFHLLCTKPSNVVSFEHILNNATNFNILLESMGCMVEKEPSNKTDLFPLRIRTKSSLDATPKYSPNKHREYNVNKPILSWRSGTGAGGNDMNINTWNYAEYIEYQRDLIQTLRNEINDIYKPLLLQNKEMEINLESLSKQADNLRLERSAMQNEMQLLTRELAQVRSDYDALNVDKEENDDNMQILQRRMSCSYAEIQESHEFLESEIMELQQNLQQTRRQSSKRNDENYKLQEINDKYSTVNTELRSNVHRMKEELDAEKRNVHQCNEDINRLKYELFEKDQRIAMLNNCVDDLSQQIQFNGYRRPPHSRRHKRSCSGNHLQLTMEFDIFNDVVLSPCNSAHASNGNGTQMEGMHMAMDQEHNNHWREMQTHKKYQVQSAAVEKQVESRLEMECDINTQNVETTARKQMAKEIATQTANRGFWETLLQQLQIDTRCFNP